MATRQQSKEKAAKETNQRLASYLKKNASRNKCLLLGNGLNRTNNAPSWEGLLTQLAANAGFNVRINATKSYPLTFEEILYRMNGHHGDNLRALKSHIYNGLINYSNTNDHRDLMQKGYSEILTTNYDYALERVLDRNYSGLTQHDSRPEWKHSLFRGRRWGAKLIWHIHGELDNGYSSFDRYRELSMMIGNEHYADYLSRMHNHIQRIIRQPHGDEKAERDSWITRFFTHNIDIAGLGLDFTENHLWWLINYRARKLKESVPFKNKIRYFYVASEREDLQDKLDLLEAFQIQLEPIETEHNDARRFREFWDIFLNDK